MFLFLFFIQAPPLNAAGLIKSFDTNSHYLRSVCVLYGDVNWHGVLPFLFVILLFFYFFTAARSLLLRARGL